MYFVLATGLHLPELGHLLYRTDCFRQNRHGYKNGQWAAIIPSTVTFNRDSYQWFVPETESPVIEILRKLQQRSLSWADKLVGWPVRVKSLNWRFRRNLLENAFRDRRIPSMYSSSGKRWSLE